MNPCGGTSCLCASAVLKLPLADEELHETYLSASWDLTQTNRALIQPE
jgi:hypothetical protein